MLINVLLYQKKLKIHSHQPTKRNGNNRLLNYIPHAVYLQNINETLVNVLLKKITIKKQSSF